MHLMNPLLFLICLTCLFSCNQANENSAKSETTAPKLKKEILVPDIQHLIDSAGVAGSVLIYDPQSETYYSNDFKRCKTGFLPASTFKIPNSIIALETGVVANDSTLFKWDGQKRRLKAWEQDLTFRDAFHLSCVPCYQEIARKVGLQRMRAFLDSLQYGHMVVDSISIAVFWLEGASKISQFEQIDFLQRFYNSELPVSGRTTAIMKRLMVIEENNKYKLSGKTGWAIRNENNYGWFTGYIESGGNVYYVATNIEPKETFNMDLFPKIRSKITMAAFVKLGFLEGAD